MKMARSGSRSRSSSTLSMEEVTCPVCLNLMIEPIVTPCNHALCKKCLTEHIGQTSLVCPVCRGRLSVWVRRARSYDNLVDQELWKSIKSTFPKVVKQRLNGVDADDPLPGPSQPQRQIAAPGELKAYYESELVKARLEAEQQRLVEEEESKKVIEQMLEEDKQQASPTFDPILAQYNGDPEWEKTRDLVAQLSENNSNVTIQSQSQESTGTSVRGSDSLFSFLSNNSESGVSSAKSRLRSSSVSSSSSHQLTAFTTATSSPCESKSSEDVDKTQDSSLQDSFLFSKDSDGDGGSTSGSSVVTMAISVPINHGKAASRKRPQNKPRADNPKPGKLSKVEKLKEIHPFSNEDSRDSITPEFSHFKPIKVFPKTPPRTDNPSGKLLKVTPRKMRAITFNEDSPTPAGTGLLSNNHTNPKVLLSPLRSTIHCPSNVDGFELKGKVPWQQSSRGQTRARSAQLLDQTMTRKEKSTLRSVSAQECMGAGGPAQRQTRSALGERNASVTPVDLNCSQDDLGYAKQLQSQFDIENRYRLTALRFKGSSNAYKLRNSL